MIKGRPVMMEIKGGKSDDFSFLTVTTHAREKIPTSRKIPLFCCVHNDDKKAVH